MELDTNITAGVCAAFCESLFQFWTWQHSCCFVKALQSEKTEDNLQTKSIAGFCLF
jgi:hypothetical protein